MNGSLHRNYSYVDNKNYRNIIYIPSTYGREILELSPVRPGDSRWRIADRRTDQDLVSECARKLKRSQVRCDSLVENHLENFIEE